MLTSVDTEGRHRLVCAGALDLESRTRLLEASAAALGAAGTTGLLLDLAAVTFIDSTGLGAIVQIAGDAEDAGLGFALGRPSDRVNRILTASGMRDLWPIEP